MKQLITGLIIGFVISIVFTGCSMAKTFLTAEPMQMIMTERNFVNTTKVTTEEGVYRIFTIEGTDGKGVGITAVKL